MKTFYTIHIWEKRENVLSGEEVFKGYSTNSNLELKSIKQALAVIKAAEIPFWEIREVEEDSLGGKPVKYHPEIKAHLYAESKEREENIQKMKGIARAINRLPKRFPIKVPKDLVSKEFKSPFSILRRDKAEYNPYVSSRVRVSLDFVRKGMINTDINVWLFDYQTDHGKLRKKKFKEELDFVVGKENVKKILDPIALLRHLIEENKRIIRRITQGQNPNSK